MGHDRRSYLFLLAGVAATAGLGGCPGAGESTPTDAADGGAAESTAESPTGRQDSPTATPTTTPTTTPTETDVSTPRPTPTDAPAVRDAKDRALAAEEAFITRRLENAACLDEWGFSAPVVDKEASVVERTGETFVVDVQHPYWYTEGETHADTGSEARYEVGPETVERVRGDDVSPC